MMNHDKYNPPGVVIPLEWLSMFEELTCQQSGQAFMAILTYSATGALPDFTDRTLQLLWPMIQARLDSNRERYVKKVERSRTVNERRAAEKSAKSSSAAKPSSYSGSTPSTKSEAALNQWL